MADIGTFFIVTSDPMSAPLRDHLQHGYEERRDFYLAVRKIVDRWKDRTGECVAERNGCLLLRFHDTPGGLPDEQWIPRYLLRPVETRHTEDPDGPSPMDDELSRAFGF